MRPLFVFLLGAALAMAATARPNRMTEQSERLLRESLSELSSNGRRLHQSPSSAVSQAMGGRSASAQAVAGPGTASTKQSAEGPGSQVAGVSQVGAKVQSCVRGPSDSAACQTLTTSDRAAACTDIPPPAADGSTIFTCADQAKFRKCDTDFIFLGAFCLQSCGRCADGCTDTPPSSGFTCAASSCNSTEVIAGPYCLKTCSRCATASAQAAAAAGPVAPVLPVTPGASAQAAAQASGSARASASAIAG